LMHWNIKHWLSVSTRKVWWIWPEPKGRTIEQLLSRPKATNTSPGIFI